jgi:inner membrane protein
MRVMDNLCHTLVGAALAECGLGRRTRYATAALVVGANLPDLDAPAAFTEYGLAFRRGITHGLPALILLPFLLTGALLLWSRLRGTRSNVEPRALLLVSAVAIVTHPLLDWMNSYGMRWLMPLDGSWVYGDSLFIIDPWLLILLGAAWGSARQIRRHRGEEGARDGARTARVLTGLALVYVLAMVGLTSWGRKIALRDLGLPELSRRQLMVSPPFLASWHREVILDTGSGYRFGEIVWNPRPVFRLFEAELPKQLDALRLAAPSTALESFLKWTRFPFVERSRETVRLDDARYAGAGKSSFAAVTISER